jgi:hypothetical protein
MASVDEPQLRAPDDLDLAIKKRFVAVNTKVAQASRLPSPSVTGLFEQWQAGRLRYLNALSLKH